MSNLKSIEHKIGLDLPLDETMREFGILAADEAAAEAEVLGNDLHEGEIVRVSFGKHIIRKIFHNGEWWFSTIDVVAALTGSDRADKYWYDLKSHIIEKEGNSEFSDKIGNLPLPGTDGKFYRTNVVTTETLLRLVQSIPTRRAEPFKRWLAKVGHERIQETHDPEIAIKRAVSTYQAQGRSDDWIEKRVRSIVVRKELTSEWRRRGIERDTEFAILTGIISQETFDVSISDHKTVKGLTSRHNIRDHMTDLELIFTMLGEKSTTEIARTRNANGWTPNKQAAQAGGKIAGSARQQLEKETSQRVVSSSNFLGKEKRIADPQRFAMPSLF
jgi:prophage antirepressor-like protein